MSVYGHRRTHTFGSRFDRRDFLRSVGLGAIATGICGKTIDALGHEWRATPRVAAIITEYRGHSHADVILGRFLQGYLLSTEETFGPRTRVVSMYVDQVPKGDLSQGMASQYGVKTTSSIQSALTLDSDQLQVDGVLIIGEHGDYPHNEKGQHMYPRRRFFEETVDTFKEVGKSVPVFNDKHLGFAWKDAKWMYDQAREMGFPLMAGSSLPTTWRRPELELPLDCHLKEGLAIGYGGIEAYGFHALETLQCMIERRRGGESGVRAVTCLKGADVWKAAAEGRWSRELLTAALDCLENKPDTSPEEGCRDPAAFVIEHNDGFRSSVLMLNGYTNAFGFAGQLEGQPNPVASHFWLQEPVYGHFAFLTHNIEQMYLEKREIYPPERTLLTTGVLDAVMTSRHEQHRRVETPWLSTVAYRAPARPGRRARF